jgi:hypothetical protein
MRDSLSRGEYPIASHLLYTQPGILDDTVPAERARGIAAGLAWGACAALTAVYVDRGITPGMEQGIAAAVAAGRPVEHRELTALRPGDPCPECGTALQHDDGEPTTWDHPGCAAFVFCPECGLEWDRDWGAWILNKTGEQA